jgi:hypothetical protein
LAAILIVSGRWAIPPEVEMERNRYGWAFVLAALLFGAAVAIVAYNIGVSDGTVVGGAAPVAAVHRVQWGWHGGGVVWLLMFALFWMFLFRGGCGRRHSWYGPYGPYWGPRRPGPDDDGFDEWHRRAHDRMKENPAADDPGRRG